MNDVWLVCCLPKRKPIKGILLIPANATHVLKKSGWSENDMKRLIAHQIGAVIGCPVFEGQIITVDRDECSWCIDMFEFGED